MDFQEKDLYTSIEEVMKKTSQDLNLLGNSQGNLKQVIKQAYVTDKNRFEDSWRKSYLLLDAKRRSKTGKKKSRAKGLTSKERKLLKIYDIPKEQQKFDLVQPLHELWCGYMEATFHLSSLVPAQLSIAQDNLTKADYHGALLRVAESTNPTLVGQEGIVVRETKNMFHIITRRDELKILPKSVCVFMCSVKGIWIKIFGNNFCARPADRIKKKLGKKRPIKVA